MNTRSLLVSCSLLLALPLPAQQPREVQLQGLVVDTAGSVVPNAALRVELRGVPVATSRSDGTGWFAVRRLPAGPVVVHATSDTAVGAAAVDLTTIEHGSVRVVLLPARTVRGRVLTTAGAAVGGAWVAATPVDGGDIGRIDAAAVSGADGRYELANVLAGPVRVLAWADGRRFQTTIDGVDDGELDCVLGDDVERDVVFELRGASTQQLAGAQLLLRAQRGDGTWTRVPPALATLRPDAAGRAVARGWTDDDRLFGRFVVAGAVVVPPIDFAPRGPRTFTCRYDVQHDAVIAGTLRGADGAPLAGQWLVCRSIDDDARDVTSSACTGDDGTFRIPSVVATGERFELTLAASDHVLAPADGSTVRHRRGHVARHEPGRTHDVAAGPGLRVRLRVVAADGQPAARVMVTLHALDAGRGSAGHAVGPVASAADGRVSFRGVDLRGADGVRVTVDALDGVASATAAAASAAGGEIDFGDVGLRAGTALAGTVRTAAGAPGVGARVELLTWGAFPSHRRTVSGRDGRFTFADVATGRARLRLAAWPPRQPWVEVLLEDGGTVDADLKLP